ncbi:MAG: DinB family protein [Bacteroidota bacterium]
MNKQEILDQLKIQKERVLEILQNSDETKFYQPKGEKWSQAEHIEHLINSIKPLNLLFSLPKILMTWKWGKPNRGSRTYDDLVKRYLEKLAVRPFQGNNPFGPKKDKNYTKEQLISLFSSNYEKLAQKIEKGWTEEQLEKYLIPHPLLGKLTVREMLMFTAYHTQHHEKAL